MIVETAFGWPGLGRLVVESIFARAGRPRLLVADEPTTALDVTLRGRDGDVCRPGGGERADCRNDRRAAPSLHARAAASAIAARAVADCAQPVVLVPVGEARLSRCIRAATWRDGPAGRGARA
jgi:hypothetical protein